MIYLRSSASPNANIEAAPPIEPFMKNINKHLFNLPPKAPIETTATAEEEEEDAASA